MKSTSILPLCLHILSSTASPISDGVVATLAHLEIPRLFARQNKTPPTKAQAVSVRTTNFTDCRSGMYANPTAETRISIGIDEWFAGHANFYAIEANDPLPLKIVKPYQRLDDGFACTADVAGRCGIVIGTCEEWLRLYPQQEETTFNICVKAYVQPFPILREDEITVVNVEFNRNPRQGATWDKYAGPVGTALGAIAGIFGISTISRENHMVDDSEAVGELRVNLLTDLVDAFTKLSAQVRDGIQAGFDSIITHNIGVNSLPDLGTLLNGSQYLLDEDPSHNKTTEKAHRDVHIVAYRDQEDDLKYYELLTCMDCNRIIKDLSK
ncbi:MAG: hypothetical protein Q9224_006187, partial [Gallowayella concinna]